MYGEDLDLCFRLQAAGWKIFYTPDTRIIHYKGESTKKGELRYVRLFYGAMLLFAEKHLTGERAGGTAPGGWLLTAGIRAAIFGRAAVGVAKRAAGQAAPALRGSARMTVQMRRRHGTSRSCPLRSKQVAIHASADASSPPRPLPLNALPCVSMARTARMNSARSCANATDSPGSSSVATVPGSQVCTAHGSG